MENQFSLFLIQLFLPSHQPPTNKLPINKSPFTKSQPSKIPHHQHYPDHCGPGFPGITCCAVLSCQSVGLRRKSRTYVCKPAPTGPARGPVQPVPEPGPTPICCPGKGKPQCGGNTQVRFFCLCVKLSGGVANGG